MPIDRFLVLLLLAMAIGMFATWPTILSEIPDAWWFVDNEQTVPVDFDTRAIETLLRGFENDEFWTWT